MSRKSYYMTTAAAVGMMLTSAVASATPTLNTSVSLSNPLGVSGGFGTYTDVGTSTSPAGLLFSKFDSSLGTLLSVKLELDFDYETVLTVSALTNADGYAVLISSLNFVSPGNVSASYNEVLGSFNYSLTGGTTVSNGVSDTGLSTLKTYSDATDLADFESPGGTGNASVDFWTSTSGLISAHGGTATASQVTQIDLQGQVTYYYHAAPPPSPPSVPEPMTAAVLGAGLAGLAAIRRRKA